MARCINTAATAESTPPDSAQMTRPSPTCARMRTIASWTKLAGVQAPVHPAMRSTKLAIISVPCGVCATSGWNWIP